MIFKESSSTSGNVNFRQCDYWHWKDCELTDNSNASGVGLYHNESNDSLFEGCVFKDNLGKNVLAVYTFGMFKTCTFDGGATTTDYGIFAELGSLIEAIDCDFGQNTDHDTYDVFARSGGTVYLRNSKLGVKGVAVGVGSRIFEEDADGIKGNQVQTDYGGTVTKDTGVTRVGGADSSAKMEPASTCGLYVPLSLNGNSIINAPFKIWTAAALTTITVYIRSLGVWAAYPTAAELYLEGNYLDHAVNATRTTVVSNDVINDETTWRAFDVTFTPLQAGWVYLNVFLKKFQAAKGCYVDVKPVVS